MPDRKVPPMGERLTRSVGHFGFFVGALWALFGPMPKSVEGSANATQLVILAVFMSTGLIGAWAALRGRYMIEYCALPFMGAASLIYSVSMYNIVRSGENPASGFALILVCVLFCYQTGRWLSLNQLMESPWKIWRKSRRESDE